MGRDGHDRSRAVLHQDVVGDEHRDALAVHRVDDLAPQRHPGLLALLVRALLGRGPGRLVDVLADGPLVLGAGRQPLDLRMLWREHEEGRPEERVRPGGEDREVEVELLAAEDDLRPLRAADPVALHGDHVLRPRLEQLEVVEQLLGVLGDPEEPLLELTQLDQRPAALAVPVDHLLVGEHGLILRAPVDGRLVAVGEAALVQLQEDPLGPAVVAGLVGAELAGPVDRDAPAHELLAEGGDRLLGRLARVLAGLDRVVLGGQPEGVVAHRMQDAGSRGGAGSGRSRRRPSRSSGGRRVARPRGRAASRARSSSASTRRTPGSPGSPPPRCSPPPRRAATCARSPAGRSARLARVSAALGPP